MCYRPRVLEGDNIKKHILIVDDDVHIGNMLEEVLTKEGYFVSRAYSGTEALLVLQSGAADLVLLDLMLPGLSGEEVLARLKGMPVIVVSAKVDIAGKVNLLLGGAADYVTKPFDTNELLARISVALRSNSVSASGDKIAFKSVELNMQTREVTVSGEPVRLTRTEYAILKLLMLNPKQVVTKSLLLERISEDTPDCTEASLKIHISNIRKKIRNAGGGETIEAVWGIGFKMAD